MQRTCCTTGESESHAERWFAVPMLGPVWQGVGAFDQELDF